MLKQRKSCFYILSSFYMLQCMLAYAKFYTFAAYWISKKETI